jgi:carotenoid cleavage dioxygenase-like enzyme
MVHAVRIKEGAASYCNRWVPTSRLAQVTACMHALPVCGFD